MLFQLRLRIHQIKWINIYEEENIIMDSEISLDTQAVLLLRGKFDSRERELTAGQYRVFAAALNTLGNVQLTC